MIESQFQIHISHLSARSQNIIRMVGGIEYILDIYLTVGHFRNISNAGEKSNKELTDLCKRILVTNPELIAQSEQLSHTRETELPTWTISQQFVDAYEQKKGELSARSRNILEALERDYATSMTPSFLHRFLHLLLTDQLDFRKVRNCGSRSEQELKAFQANMLHHAGQHLTYTRNASDDLSQQNVALSFRAKLSSILHEPIDSPLLDSLITEDTYNLGAACIILASRISYKPREKAVIQHYFYNQEELTLEAIGQMSGITRERARQIVENFRKKKFAFMLRVIQSDVSMSPTPLSTDGRTDHTIFVAPDWPFGQCDFDPKPGRRLIELVTALRLGKEYQRAKKVHPDVRLRALDIGDSKLYIHLPQQAKALQFVNWIDKEIVLLPQPVELTQISELIGRYCEETDPSLTCNDASALASIIHHTAQQLPEMYPSIRKREHNSRIISICVECLKEADSTLSTKDLIEKLREEHIDITPAYLRELLNDASDRLMKFGANSWALAEWKDRGMLAGNFRQLAAQLLEKSPDPIHLSEIHRYIQSFRPVPYRSLETTLRASQKPEFIFLPYGFVGLSERQYPERWHKTSPLNPHHFLQRNLAAYAGKSITEIAVIYNNLYGYPVEFTRHRLESRTS